MQQILTNEKKALKKDEVISVNVEKKYWEFSVKRMWKYVKEEPELVEYMFDEEIEQERYPDKEWFWGVLTTLRT